MGDQTIPGGPRASHPRALVTGSGGTSASCRVTKLITAPGLRSWMRRRHANGMAGGAADEAAQQIMGRPLRLWRLLVRIPLGRLR